MIICEKCYADFDEEIIDDVFTILCPKCRGVMEYREEDHLKNNLIELTEEMRKIIDNDETGDILMSDDLIDFLYEQMNRLIDDDEVE